MKSFHRQDWVAKLITTLQEAYSSIIPYFLLISTMALFLAFLRNFEITFLEISPQSIAPLLNALDLFSSIVIIISIAYFFARQIEVSTIIAIMLSIASYASVMIHEESEKLFLYGFSYGFVIQTLLIPIVSTYFLRLLYPWFNLRIPLEDQNLHVYRLFNYIFVFLAAYIATMVLYQSVDYIMDLLIEMIQNNIHLDLPEIISLILRETVVQLFWFLGLNGDHTVDAIFGRSLLGNMLFPHLTVAEFNRLFVSRGGAGAGIAMLLAFLWHAREGIARTISRISIPFVFFNINILLIYAVVVFNRFLFIPFVGIPILNSVISYIVLSLVPISFNTLEVTWLTPVFLDGYLKSDGDLYVVLLQISLLVIDTAIYLYYVRKYMISQSYTLQMQSLKRNLDLPYKIRTNRNIRSFTAHREIISSSAKLEKVLSSIDVTKMMVYFQPKVSIETGKCDHFEALLRYRDSDRISVPYFLRLVENAGMSGPIDMWVAKEVSYILDRWEKEENFLPNVSINIHPDTLANHEILRDIAMCLKGYNVMFEIVERSFSGEGGAKDGLLFLENEGFGISIDDYGIGYSNLESIINHNITEIKIDKALIDRLDEERGILVCKHIISLSNQLGIDVVAEGVEELEQALHLIEMDVKYIQGYFFTKALSAEDILQFTKSFDLSSYLSKETSSLKV